MHKKVGDRWFILGLLFSVLIVIGYIFWNTKDNAQSDWATAVLLAREQMRSKQWFPDTWVYAQSIWTASLNLLVIPFLYITHNMLFARELAVLMQTLVGTWLCYAAMKRIMNNTNSALFVCILLLIPLSVIVNRNFFFEATYYPCIVWTCLIILIGSKVVHNWKGNKIAFILWGIFWIVLGIALTLSDAKLLVMIVAPFCGALIVWQGIRSKGYLLDILKNYKVIVILAILLGGAGVGTILNCYLKKMVLFDEGVATLSFAESDQWGVNLIKIFGAFVQMYGLDGVGAVVSVHGILSIVKGVFAIVLTLGIPVWTICNYSKLKNVYQQIFALYSFFAAFLMIYICMISEGVGDSGRYFLGIYINNMVLAGICFDCVICENRYYRRLVLTVVLAVSGLCAVQYRNYKEIEFDEYQEMIAFLKEQNIDYGYADYWNAGVTTVLSNGEVELVAHESGRQGTPLYWLCSTKWYEPDYHEGDFCFVIKKGEYVDERYRQASDEIYQIGEFEILIFREDEESTAKLFFAFPQKTGDSYTFNGDNYYFRSNCGIVENTSLISQGGGAFAYGQYCVLAPGTYRLELNMEVTGTSGCSVEMASASTVFGSAWCANGSNFVVDNIVVPKRTIGSEIRIMLGANTEVTLKSITITKVK